MEEIIKIQKLILKRLEQPFIVDSSILHYAESTLGIDVEELAEHLIEDNGVIDLVVVPDIDFRKTIEPYIPCHGISNEDIAEIVHNIEYTVTNIPIDIKGKCVLYNNPSHCKVFIYKLYLQKENIAIPYAEELFNKYIAARVAIRLFAKNHDLQMLKKLVDALVQESSESVLYDSIKLFTNIVGKEADIYTVLSVHKQRLQKQLWDMYEFKKLLEQYSMEFIMSMRRSSPMVDAQAIGCQIQLIDTMCIALSGLPARGFVPDFEMEIDSDTLKKFLNTI